MRIKRLLWHDTRCREDFVLGMVRSPLHAHISSRPSIWLDGEKSNLRILKDFQVRIVIVQYMRVNIPNMEWQTNKYSCHFESSKTNMNFQQRHKCAAVPVYHRRAMKEECLSNIPHPFFTQIDNYMRNGYHCCTLIFASFELDAVA